MSNYNLTNQEIRNTFEQLGQLSGSIEGGVSGYAVLDGTGSRATTLHVTASNATTATSASYAANGGVTSIIAGTNVTISPVGGTGAVTINSSGGGGSADTGSLLTTASADFSEITFTKGDSSTFTIDATPRKVIETVKNKSGATLAKGTPVYVSGSTGNASNVYPASASLSSRMPAAYVLGEQLVADAEGQGIALGFINGVDTSAFSAGDSIYVGASGGYTNQKPTGSNLIQKLGNVIKVDATNGSGVITGAGRSNDLPNITAGYAWVGNSDGVPTAVATSSFSVSPFPFTGNAQITGSLVVSGSGLSSGEDVFVLGAPRTGGSSLQGVIRSTVDDGMYFYGNKFFSNGANTFSGGITGFESGPVQFGPAGSPVNIEMQNGSAITASNGTLPIKGDVDVDGDITVDGGNTTINIGNTTAATATPNLKLFQAFNGTDVKFANISINDTTGTYARNTLIGQFSNANSIGNSAGDPYTVIAGGADGGEFLHWSIILDQSGDIKLLKEVAMRSGANITGSLDISANLTASNASFQSASIGHLQTITGSATIIGDEYIILNADSPTARYAGIKVYDSGSGLTGSFEWDSVDDNWIQVDTGGSSAGMLTGTAGSKGSEVYPTANTLLKGTGNHTVVDSNITDNGVNIVHEVNTRFDDYINFNTTTDIRQQGFTFISGGYSDLTITSNNLDFEDVSSNPLANINQNNISLKKNTSVTGSVDITGSLTANLEEISTTGLFAIPTISGSGSQKKFVDVKWAPRVDAALGTTNFGGVNNSPFAPAIKVTGSYSGTGNITGQNITANGYLYSVAGAVTSGTGLQAGYAGSSGTVQIKNSSNGGLQFPTFDAFTNTTDFTQVFSSHRIQDSNPTGSSPAQPVAIELSSYTGKDGVYPVSQLRLGPNEGASGGNTVMWSSENYPWVTFDKSVSFESPVTSSAIISASAGIIAGATSNFNNVHLDGNLQVTGSLQYEGTSTGKQQTLSIVSNTASLDPSTGDYFTLTLVSGSNTVVDVGYSDSGRGTTFILECKQPSPAGGTIEFINAKFPGGTAPTASPAGTDIYTFVGINGGDSYGVQTANFI